MMGFDDSWEMRQAVFFRFVKKDEDSWYKKNTEKSEIYDQWSGLLAIFPPPMPADSEGELWGHC